MDEEEFDECLDTFGEAFLLLTFPWFAAFFDFSMALGSLDEA